jgi:hypothetical protein
MAETVLSRPPQEDGEPQGCAYPIGRLTGTDGEARHCGRPRRPGSEYCPFHHARCHLPTGSRAEALRLHAIETIAAAVGGRCGGADAMRPPPRFLARLERLLRDFS